MNKPHWQKLHDWWVEDFKDFVSQKLFFLGLLRKHPGDASYITTVKGIEKVIEGHQKAYKKLYGTRFNLNRVKEKE